MLFSFFAGPSFGTPHELAPGAVAPFAPLLLRHCIAYTLSIMCYIVAGRETQTFGAQPLNPLRWLWTMFAVDKLLPRLVQRAMARTDWIAALF